MNVILKSGRYGWRMRLRKVYDNFAEFEHYDRIYNLARRIGYKSAANAWKRNPMVEGSVNPSDYGRAK